MPQQSSLSNTNSLSSHEFPPSLSSRIQNMDQEAAANIIIDHFQVALEHESKDNVSLYALLKAMIEHAPSPEGKQHIVSIVARLRSEQAVVEVAKDWLSLLIYPMLSLNRVTNSASSDHTPLHEDLFSGGERAVRIQQRELRRKVALRDKHRCTITGNFDVYYKQRPSGKPYAVLEATSILPLSLEGSSMKPELSKTWDMLRAWTSIDVLSLVRDDIDAPKNTIMMGIGLVDFFKAFLLYFDRNDDYSDSEGRKYKVRSSDNGLIGSLAVSEVTCEFNTDTGIEPPDPRLLAIHAALAKVIHACGAGEHFSMIVENEEEIGVLNSDGTSDIGALLSCRLAIPLF